MNNYNKKISQFIVWDLIETMQKYDNNDFLNSITLGHQNAVKKYNKYKFALDFFDKLYNKVLKLFFKRNKKGKKFLFYGTRKYPSIPSETNKNHKVTMLVSGKSDRLLAFKNLIGYISISDLHRDIYNYLNQKDDKYLYELIKKLEERIKTINPDYIVLSGDCLPIQRAIILASKKLEAITIFIQDAIYGSTFPLIDGRVVDYVLVSGQYFKNLYIKEGFRKSEDIYILGYPQTIEKNKEKQIAKKYYTVYYLGQNLEMYDKNLLDIKLKTVRKINKICKKIGMKFIYRPHPGDDRKMLKNRLPEVSFTSKKESLTETFKKGDIFISFSSTSLVEAAMRSKLCLQLINFPGKMDNFKKLGISDDTFNTIEELEKYLIELSKSPNLDKFKSKFNNNYIQLFLNPTERFLEIIDDIEKNKKNI